MEVGSCLFCQSQEFVVREQALNIRLKVEVVLFVPIVNNCQTATTTTDSIDLTARTVNTLFSIASGE